MALLYQSHIYPEGVYGIWENSEEDDFFVRSMQLFPEEEQEIMPLKARKRMEWLSSRHLLHTLSKREIRGACLKDTYGKPYLKDSPYYISISHTADFTAVIAAPKVVGIDIQVIVPKISRIAARFIRDDENEFIDMTLQIEYYHAIWGAKESMYKAYGKKELDFRKHMKVLAFYFDGEGFFFEGEVEKGDFYRKYTLFCKQIENLILVYAVEQ